MAYTVTRTLQELTDTELFAEYDKRSEAGNLDCPERKELRAEIERRMGERHGRRCWCQNQGLQQYGLGQLGALGIGVQR